MQIDPEGFAPDTKDNRMQRVRVGVTGLAAVMLMATLAAAVASGVARNVVSERPPGSSNALVSAAENTIDSTAEPLAQLGVAPGGSEEAEQAKTAR